MNRRSRKAFVWIVALCLIFTSFGSVSAASSSDVKGHWAEATITSWMDKGLVSGYEDGSFRPEAHVSRQEFTAFVNRSFGFVELGSIEFTDVTQTDWSYLDISKAKAAGYIAGYADGTFQPTKEISRQEAAVIITNLLGLEKSSSADLYTDTKNSPGWSKSAIGAVKDHGIMGGYPDGTFRPERSVTRAEAVVLLDRALTAKASIVKTTTYNKAGTYGPLSGTMIIEGNVVISAKDVTLQNVKITGDLLLAESIGEGDVFLKKVTVLGKTTVQGGGVNSIHIEDSVLGTVLVNKPNGSVRIVASGTTTVGEVTLQSSTKLEESKLTGNGFKDVSVSSLMPDGSTVQLSGEFEAVDVNANNISVDIPTGLVNDLNMNTTSTGTSVTVGSSANIDSLTLGAAVSILGQGTIDSVQINMTGASIQQTPTIINVAPGVSATVGGSAAVSTPTPTPPASTPTSETPSPSTLSSSKAMTSFNFAGLTPDVVGTINEGAKTIGLTVPFGTNVTALVPSITSLGIRVSPSTGVSRDFTNPVTYTVTAENGTTVAYQVTVTATSTVTAGARVTIDAPATGITAWLAPANTTVFIEDPANMTSLVGNNVATTIIAPTTLADYKLFLVNEIGPVASVSPVGTLTVAVGWGVDLGTSGNFAILAKTGVSTVPSSMITGNVGVSPIFATGLTGFTLTQDSGLIFSTSTQVVGQVFAPDYASPTSSNLTTAVLNMETAYTDAAGRAPNYTELNSGNISGLTLTAGVYKWGTSVLIDSGTEVTLSGSANDVWIFQIAGGLTQASATRIILADGAKAENIFWQVADTVAIGEGAHFEGIILGMKNISLDTSASMNGRLLSQTAVTLDQNVIVEPIATTDLGKVNLAKANLSLGDIDTEAVTEDLELPIVQDGATVTWSSGNTLVITDSGVVARASSNTVVILTATIEAGSEMTTKEFTVKVLAIIE
jgi:hypothetical protein